MTNEQPLVSVGLPIYNAGELTHKILDILLSQDYTNIQIIISDNASTDQTWEICQQYALKNDRIQVYQNKRNRGYLYNFSRVFDLSTGDYFMWAAHDDYWHPNFISCCVAELETHPEAIMCFTDQLHIHEETGEKKLHNFASLNLMEDRTSLRVRNLLTYRPLPHAIFYSMFRRDRIVHAVPAPPVPSADIALLSNILLRGKAAHVPEVLYERCITPGVDFRTRMQMLRPDEVLPPNFIIVLQMLRTLVNYVWESAESFWSKMRLTLSVTRYVFSSYALQFVPRSLQPMVRRLKRILINN